MNKLQLGNNNSNYPECHDLTFEFWHSDSSLLLCFYLWILNRSFMTHFLKKRLLWTCQNSSCNFDDANDGKATTLLVIKNFILDSETSQNTLMQSGSYTPTTITQKLSISGLNWLSELPWNLNFFLAKIPTRVSNPYEIFC